MQPDQAANELTEEQMLNFLVNTLDEEIDIESLVIFGTDLSNRGLIDAGEDNDRPDIARNRGAY